jgi:hypothetical protein
MPNFWHKVSKYFRNKSPKKISSPTGRKVWVATITFCYLKRYGKRKSIVHMISDFSNNKKTVVIPTSPHIISNYN